MYPNDPNDPFGNGQRPSQEDGCEDQGNYSNSYLGDDFAPFTTGSGGFPGPGFFPVNGTQMTYGAGMEGYISNPFLQSPFMAPMPSMVGFYNNNGFEQNQLMNVLNTSNAVSIWEVLILIF